MELFSENKLSFKYYLIYEVTVPASAACKQTRVFPLYLEHPIGYSHNKSSSINNIQITFIMLMILLVSRQLLSITFSVISARELAPRSATCLLQKQLPRQLLCYVLWVRFQSTWTNTHTLSNYLDIGHTNICSVEHIRTWNL